MRVAVLGPGAIADRKLAPAANAAGLALWSVLSRDRARGEAFARKHALAAPAPVHTELATLLADPLLEAVIIATPDALHAEQAIAAARAGKHVLCEKPLCTTHEDGVRMIAAAKEAGVVLAVAYHLRHHAGHQALHAEVGGGAIGALRHVRAQWVYKTANASNWRASRAVGRWWSLAGVGTHCVDLVRWFAGGEVTQLGSAISRDVYQCPNDETAVLALRFDTGVTAEILVSVLFDAPSRLDLHGSAASASAAGTLGPEGKGEITIAGAPLDFTPADPYAGELADFAAAVRDHRPPAVDGEEGLRNVDLLLRAAP